MNVDKERKGYRYLNSPEESVEARNGSSWALL